MKISMISYTAKTHNNLLLSPLRGWDLRSGASHLHYGPKARR